MPCKRTKIVNFLFRMRISVEWQGITSTILEKKITHSMTTFILCSDETWTTRTSHMDFSRFVWQYLGIGRWHMALIERQTKWPNVFLMDVQMCPSTPNCHHTSGRVIHTHTQITYGRVICDENRNNLIVLIQVDATHFDSFTHHRIHHI